MVEKKVKNKTCVNCGSNFTYVRIKDGSVVCRNCGYISKIEEQNKTTENDEQEKKENNSDKPITTNMGNIPSKEDINKVVKEELKYDDEVE